MSLDNEQYTPRGTKPSWRKWKRRLKRQTARKARQGDKRAETEGEVREEPPPRRTRGWTD